MSKALIHESQLNRISRSKVKNLPQTVSQRYKVAQDQTEFLFTVIGSDSKIVKTVFEVNGIPYSEFNQENQFGAFIRRGTSFEWVATEANGGFDMQDGMFVLITITYLTDEDDTPESTQVIPTNPSDSRTGVVGDYNQNPDTYFEQYDLTQQEIERFLGVNVNGATYAHPTMVSYSNSTGVLTLNKIQVKDNDTFAVMSNT